MKSNPLRKLDNFVLGAFDAIVFWFWNRFEVRRIWLIRLAFGLWIVMWVVEMGLNSKPGELRILDWFLILANVLIEIIEESKAKQSTKMQNARTATSRLSSFSFFFRNVLYFIFFQLMLFAFLDFAFGVAIRNVIWNVSWFSYMMLCYTWTPMEPPKRKIRLSVPAFRMAVAKT